MRNKMYYFVAAIIMVCSFLSFANDFDHKPIAISPGRDQGMAIVELRSPTFSWSGLDWAVSYRVAVFIANHAEIKKYDEMLNTVDPIVMKEIRGQAVSWTPSADEGLLPEYSYVWYVGAIDGSGHIRWSEGKTFKIVSIFSMTVIEENLQKILRDAGVGSEQVTQQFSGNITAGQINRNKKEIKSTDNQPKMHSPQGTEHGNYTYYGISAGGSSTAVGNSCFGTGAGGLLTTGTYNTFLGSVAGYNNTEGAYNVCVGENAGRGNTTGNNNVYLGGGCAYYSTTGNNNVFMGGAAGYFNNTGSNNTYLGYYAGYGNILGNGNLFIGHRAGYNEAGSDKLYIDNSDTITPLIWGDFASDVMAINGNLGIGTNTPSSEIEISKTGTSPIFNIQRTDGAHFRLVAGRNNVQIGAVTSHGIKYLAGGSWKMQLNADGTLVMADGGSYNGTWNDASSREFKENIEVLDEIKAFAALENLEPVTFNYKKDKEELHVGFIAEDVPDLLASKDRKNLSTMDIVAVLTRVVKEQQKTNLCQQKTIEKLKKRIEKLEKK